MPFFLFFETTFIETTPALRATPPRRGIGGEGNKMLLIDY